MLDNRAEFLLAVLPIVRAGGVIIPLGTRLGSAEVAYIAENARPRFAVTAAKWRGKLPVRSSIETIYVVDDGGLPQAEMARSFPALAAEDLIAIIYTSGTTGKPKGAILTHVNFVHTCLHYLYALALDAPLRSMLALPATHIAGFGPLMSVTLASAGTIVMLPEFKATKAMAMIEAESVNFVVMVPTMYQLCMMSPDLANYDLSSWIYGVYGGAIMPPAVIERVRQNLPRLRLINAYGATKTCAVCTIMPPEATDAAPSSVGLPLACDEIRIMSADGAELPVGETGELWIRGPNVSPGYWENDVAANEAFADGFWRSGDIGSRDEEGRLYIHDRLKDMITRGGFKVFSAEVENALMAHPDVADCAVFGVPDSVLGERTVAQIMLKTDDEIDGDALLAFLTDRIADYKLPDFWRLGRDPLPRNQNGKLQKAVLRDAMLAEQAPRDTS